MNVLIMGGDQRYVEVINQLTAKGIRLFLAGFDELTFSNPNICNLKLDEIEFDQADAILLPVSGTGINGEIGSEYSKKHVHLSAEMLMQTPEHCIVYTGISNEYLDNTAKKANRKVVCLFDRDELAILNSIPVSEAVLQIAISETDDTIHSSNVMIVGFGRTAVTIARLFYAVGANVSVAARKASDFARIKEMRLQPIELDHLGDHLDGIDICINTVPHVVLDKNVLSKTPQSTLIIDIASMPGGTDFTFAKERGIKAIHALGLPGKTAPKAAGEMISDVLFELLFQIKK